jgi:glyoxylase-like metal-dependent hydrolase (beta-lactamase superfamily II)
MTARPTSPGDLYEVVVVKHGTRAARRSDVFLNNQVYGEPDDPLTVDYYLWVVRSRTTTVLVDTGFARSSAEARGRTVLIDPAEAYRRFGVNTHLSHPVIVMHAHYDYIGNLGLFSACPVIISGTELDFWATPLATKPLLGHFTEAEGLATLAKAALRQRVRRFSGTYEVAPGVVVTEVGGHTPGQCMVTVPTSDGVVLLTSDAVHFAEELARDRPFTSVTDLPASYQALQTVRDLVARRDRRWAVTSGCPFGRCGRPARGRSPRAGGRGRNPCLPPGSWVTLPNPGRRHSRGCQDPQRRASQGGRV